MEENYPISSSTNSISFSNHQNWIKSNTRVADVTFNGSAFHCPDPKLSAGSNCTENNKQPPNFGKLRFRRHKANARERNRMHGLNAALDRLRKRCVPFCSPQFHKLSKIETIRLPKNYIEGLSETLQRGEQIPNVEFARMLSKGISESTVRIINECMCPNPRSID